MEKSSRSSLAGTLQLRDVTDSDLPTFFEQQLDPAANHMAAFTSRDPADKAAFSAHWSNILADDTITIKTILFKDHVAGHIAQFGRFGETEVSYWIGQEYWNKGITTEALSQFIHILPGRPLFARVAKDNIASIRVLEKCGFAVSGEEKAFAQARGEPITELIYKLL